MICGTYKTSNKEVGRKEARGNRIVASVVASLAWKWWLILLAWKEGATVVTSLPFHAVKILRVVLQVNTLWCQVSPRISMMSALHRTSDQALVWWVS